MFSSWYKKFSSQPHQPFFSSGILFFLLFMFLLFLQYANLATLKTPLLTYHAYSMIFVIFIQFFLGFLYVVFPRFLIQAEITPSVYMKHFHLYFFGSLGFFISVMFFPALNIVFEVLILVAQIVSFKLLYTIHKNSIVQVKTDTKWILIAFLTGMVSHFYFIISNFDFTISYTLSKVAINSGFYLFLFMIIFTVSQRMIPFFTTAKVPNYIINKSKNLLPIVFSLLILKVFLLSFENPKLNILADLPLLIIMTKELIRWKLPFFKVPAIMWILYLALYWIVIGFGLSIIESLSAIANSSIVFEKAVIHTFALGYFFTALIGFGTRVILGHSGSTPHASNFAIAVFIYVQFLTLLRILSAFSLNFDFNYTTFISVTAILLIVGVIIWSSKYITILLKGK